jgi:VanZ family protein
VGCKLPLDKQHHIVYSFALALAGAILFGAVKGVVLALLVGVGKEVIYDCFLGRGDTDIWDMAANCIGVVLAYTCYFAFQGR